MAQITGKYVATKVAEFVEQLKKDGAPEDWIKSMSEGKIFLEFKHDGNKVWFNDHNGNKDNLFDLVLNEEVENKVSWGTNKTFTTLNGNVLTLKTSRENGDSYVRTFNFSGDGVEAVFGTYKGLAPRTLIYKKE